MIIGTLKRKESHKDGLFGVLSLLNDEEYITLERSRNQKEHGPIPAGIYALAPHTGTKYKNAVALVNEKLGVYHWPNKKAIRSAILIHQANWQTQLRGCIALGAGITNMKDQRLGHVTKAITMSGITVKKFMEFYTRCREGDNGQLQIEIIDE